MVEAASIQRVGIVGAGTMGRQIGLVCAWHGYRVVLYDTDPAALASATVEMAALAEEMVAAGRLARPQAEAALARVQTTGDLASAAQVDLISESIPEDPALKGKLFAGLNALSPQETLFTTNSSSLVPSMYAQTTGRPDRFAALHFHQPVWESNVVDIMPHAGTAAATMTRLESFARSIGQIPIVMKQERHGYVFNAMYNALNREALALAASGAADYQDVDRAWMGVMKMPIGPFGMLDVVGLKTVWQISSFWAGVLGDAQLQANADFVRPYVEAGKLGRKSGEGFYKYPNPAFESPTFLTGRDLGEA